MSQNIYTKGSVSLKTAISTCLLIVMTVCAAGSVFGSKPVGGGGPTLEDFKLPGTQPLGLAAEIETSEICSSCHGFYDPVTEPYSQWKTSMMANSMRDPMFHACLTIAEQDMPSSGELCIRCHSPGGWLEGRSTPTDGSALTAKDYEGVNCNVCHRMVDPDYKPGVSPAEDLDLLSWLSFPPADFNSGNFVIDPFDRRRGPYDLGENFPWHEWLQSPFHRQSQMCGTCHDVSNPAFTRSGGAVPSASDTYVVNDMNTPHPTGLKRDQFPLERTFSEWSGSSFAQGPIEMGGRFGGNKTAVSTCQDCHMPDVSGVGCQPVLGPIFHNDLPEHTFRGANTWVLKAVRILDQSYELYGPDKVSGLTDAQVNQAIADNIDFLSRASDMELSKSGSNLNVRIINQTGHKLPTGYGEGRRMWINVKFLNNLGQVIGEHGAYNAARAKLDKSSTKIYEVEFGADEALAALYGLVSGPSFRFVLSNKIFKDNRIPPRGFTNAGFEALQAHPVGATYADGQYWDDTQFAIPPGAVSASVTLYYQTTSKEYIEFLRDMNYTNNLGRLAWRLWIYTGMSAPAAMDQATISLVP